MTALGPLGRRRSRPFALHALGPGGVFLKCFQGHGLLAVPAAGEMFAATPRSYEEPSQRSMRRRVHGA